MKADTVPNQFAVARVTITHPSHNPRNINMLCDREDTEALAERVKKDHPGWTLLFLSWK